MRGKQFTSYVASILIPALLFPGTLVMAINPRGHFRSAYEIEQPPVPDDIETPGLMPVPDPGMSGVNLPGVNLPGSEVSGPLEIDSRWLVAGDYQEDWRQAGNDEQYLGTMERQHFVRLGADGTMQGTITQHGFAGERIPVAGMKINLIGANGAITASEVTGPAGEFLFGGLTPGVVGLVAQGPGGLTAFGLNLLPEETLVESEAVADVAELELEHAAITVDDVPLAASLIAERVADGISGRQWSEPETVPVGNGTQLLAPVPGTTLRDHDVHLQADGSLIGRVRALHPDSGRPLRPRDMSAFLLQGGALVAESPVRPNGTFTIEAVEPGIYSFVTAGRDGFAVCSIHVLPADGVGEPEAVGGAIRTSHVAENPELDVALVFPLAVEAFLNELQETLPEEVADMCPMACCGMGGWGGGFGGGAGGGWGWLPWAALAAGIAALAADDDDGNPAPATPIGP